MNAVVQNTFSSHSAGLSHYKCLCAGCSKSKKEYNPLFAVSFIDTGNFYYHAFNKTLEVYTGYILVTKPGYEYQVSHVPGLPDECHIFNFAPAVYDALQEEPPAGTGWFFKNKDVQTVLVKASPALEYLYKTCLANCTAGAADGFKAGDAIMQLLQHVLAGISHEPVDNSLPQKMRQQHLPTIETAKHFIHQQYTSALSLEQLARYCRVSPFHFSRLFKTITGYSPYSYVQHIRLKSAELQLQQQQRISDIAFNNGFASADYFSAAFKKKYKCSPLEFMQAQKK